MPDRTLVASATDLLLRGYQFVPTDRRAPGGAPVNGLFAVARAIQRALAMRLPARAVAVIDAGAGAQPWPELLRAQLEPLADLLAALGLGVVVAPDEPDVVAAYAQAAVDRGDDVIIVGQDKRYAQLVDERVWWYDAQKDARYTPEVVFKRFGVPPARVAEWLALVGDEDSALPGIAGVGAKGATTLLTTYGSIDGALAAGDAVKGRLGNALRAAREEIPRELGRARLDRRRPLPVALDALAYRPPDAARLNAAYERLGFVELLVSGGKSAMRVATCATAADLAAVLAQGTLAMIAGEAGIALSAGHGEASWVPAGGAAWPAVVAWLEDAAAPKIGHDLGGTIVALARAGVTLRGVAGDSACASHLTQPSNWAPHDLDVTAKFVLGRALPPPGTPEAAGEAADACMAVWRALSPAVDPGLMADYLYLTGTCARMEQCGVTVDRAALDRAEKALAEIEAELTGKIEALAGHSFNINSTKQLGTVLFEELKLPVASHTKTGWSVATEALERIEHAHPIVALVIRWRLLRRLRDAWVGALYKYIAADGRVHARFQAARSFSGHLVCSSPDLGRVPGRTPEMEMIRRAFVAPPGRLLMSVDYNQLGLYVLAHLTKDPALVEPLRARADMHLLTASAVLEKPASEVTPDERQLGKVVNFATFAGQGASALALQLGVPAAEAKEMIARFDRRYARVREFQDEQLRLARERGYIVTLAGRKWPIGGLESLDPHDRSYAERLARRATHEGSVADVARRALLEAERALRRAGLRAVPVHEIVDEVLFEVPEEELAEAARVAAAAMRRAYELEVPLVVGVEAGPSWADLSPVKMG